MIIALTLVVLLGAIGVIVAALDDEQTDRATLYAMGLILIVRVWAWPNQLHRWDYRALHHRRGSPAMVGQPRPAGKVVAELRRVRAQVAARLALEAAHWREVAI